MIKKIVVITLISANTLFASLPGLNVKDYGATGDGSTDDTTSITTAIQAGKTQRLPVYFPQGNYRITQSLSIDAQSLIGIEAGGWNADSKPMATLKINHDQGPGLIMYNGASIHGLAFDYSGQQTTNAAILLSGIGLHLSNIRIQYCYRGIIADGISNVGRVNIENVLIVQPQETGVYVTETWDVSSLRNIEVWNNNPQMFPGPGFKFGKNDLIQCVNLSVVNLSLAFQFIDTDPANDNGTTWGTFSNCSSDMCSSGWNISGNGHRLMISGGSNWNHWHAFDINDPNSRIQILNADMKTNGGSLVWSQDAKQLIVNGCNIGRFINPYNAFMVHLQKADMVTISDCLFDDKSPVIKIHENVKQALIVDNIFSPSNYTKLDITTGSDSEIHFADNVGYCSHVLNSDLNFDCHVNMSDFSIMAEQWLAN